MRRKHQGLVAELEALPPVKKDFSTPEGAILCLEATYPKEDLEAAVNCHDFETDARLYLRDAGYSASELEELLPKFTEVMETTFRKVMGPGKWPTCWNKAKSYFVKREAFAEGIVIVSEITVGPDGSLFRQRIIVSKTRNGWRVVRPLIDGHENGPIKGI